VVVVRLEWGFMLRFVVRFGYAVMERAAKLGEGWVDRV